MIGVRPVVAVSSWFSFARRAFALAVIAALSLCEHSVAAFDEAVAERPPNILFVVTDDQGPWALGVSGQSQAKTPRIDRLAAEGVRFTNALTPTPVCSPARASIMTSRYGSELGITDWINPSVDIGVGLAANIPTWPGLLRQRGYETALFGKWHLGDLDEQHPTKRGYGTFVGFRGGGTTPFDPLLEKEFVVEKRDGFVVDLVTDATIAWLRDRKRSKPFAVSVHYREPHAAYLPVPATDWEQVRDLQPTVPEPDITGIQSERIQKTMREYLASVAAIDRNVGRLLDTLDELQLSRDTIVIFTSDHGYNLGHHGLLYKGNAQWMLEPQAMPPGTTNVPRGQRPNMFDTSLRVPLVIRWPGTVPAGIVEHRTVSHLDWMPTFAALANEPTANETTSATKYGSPSSERSSTSDWTMRGRNLLPLFKGNAPAWENDFYAEYSMKHGARVDMRMYRTPEWKLVRDFNNPDRDELYHLAVDPREKQNLIKQTSDEVRREVVALDQKILAKLSELEDPILAKAKARLRKP